MSLSQKILAPRLIQIGTVHKNSQTNRYQERVKNNCHIPELNASLYSNRQCLTGLATPSF